MYISRIRTSATALTSTALLATSIIVAPLTPAAAEPTARGDVRAKCAVSSNAALPSTLKAIRSEDQVGTAVPPEVAPPPPLPNALAGLVPTSGPVKTQASSDSGNVRRNATGNIGSITKTFTAALILQLDQQKKLSINDKLWRWRTQINWKGDRNILKRISLKQVLQHTSGIPDTSDTPQIIANEHNPTFKPRPRQVVGWASALPPTFPAGTSWKYSNTNFMILGLVAESVGRKSLAKLFTQRFFKPLGLRDTTLGSANLRPTVASYLITVNQTTTPKQLTWERFANQTNNNAMWAWAAGGIQSTSCDLGVWVRALISGKVLDRAHRKLMQTASPQSRRVIPNTVGPYASPYWTGYGLGLMQYKYLGTVGWGHGGNITGFASSAVWLPSRKRGISLITPFESSNTWDATRRLLELRAR